MNISGLLRNCVPTCSARYVRIRAPRSPASAPREGTASDEHEDGDIRAIWLEDGNKILNYTEADERFNAASFRDGMEEQGVVIHKNDLTILIENRRTLARLWRRSIGEHGELVFYIDAR